MKILKSVILSCSLLLFTTSSAHAGLIGSINSCAGGGLTATFDWSDCGAALSWQGVELGGGLRQITYELTVARKDISHFQFGVSEDFTTANIFAGTTDGWELDIFGNEGGSNPGQPAPFNAVKYEVSDLFGDVLSATVTLVSDRIFEWRDFYAVDGKTPGREVYAFNSSFGQCSGTDISVNQPGCILGFDTGGGGPPNEVSEPGTLGLGLIGSLAGSAWLRRRKVSVSEHITRSRRRPGTSGSRRLRQTGKRA